MKFFSVLDKLPDHYNDVLVWTGRNFIVSKAHFYDAAEREMYASWVLEAKSPNSVHNMSEKEIKHYLECTGYFEVFSETYYFDDPKVQWAELPRAPYI